MISSQLFEAYLACPTKCLLQARGVSAKDNAIATWFENRKAEYLRAGIKRFQSTPGIVFDRAVAAPGFDTKIHAIQTVRLKGKNQLVPLRFVNKNKLSRTDRLVVGFDGVVLSKSSRVRVDVGRLIHGDEFSTVRVKIDALSKEVAKLVERITELQGNSSEVDPILNRHCPECEFRDYCRRKATDKNDLSLLSSLPAQERLRWNRRGIFTVNQLSYAFRPRRRAKRFVGRPEKHHHSLQALAIREKKIYLVGAPSLHIDGTPVFLDVEGIPERDFFYLIGVSWEQEGTLHRRYFWANLGADEEHIWHSFLDLLTTIDSPLLVHYGSFETTFLNKMRRRYGEPVEGTLAARAISSSTNLLSVLFAHVYFPTYSNSLKDIARLLGFEWTDPLGSGLQSIVWRHQWEESGDVNLRERLITYNAEDCDALRIITGVIRAMAAGDEALANPEIVRVESLTKSLGSKWRAFESPIEDLVQINATAHWNYQRNHVFIRSKPIRRSLRKARPTRRPSTRDGDRAENIRLLS